MLFDPQLNEAKQLIDVGDETSAKAIVVPYLQKNPQSADAWWLFAILTDTDADAVLALQRALAIDPTHYEANRALEKLQGGLDALLNKSAAKAVESPPTVSSEKTKTSEVTSPKSPSESTLDSYEITGESFGEAVEFPIDDRSRPKAASRLPSESAARMAKFGQQTPNVMEAVARAYASYGWTATRYSPQQTVMEKRTGVDWIWPLLLLIIPFVGLMLLVTNFFIRRTYTITITSQKRGQNLHFGGDVKSVTLDQDALLAGTVPIPMPEININYLTAIMIGGVASVVVICGLCIGLLLLVDVEDADDVEPLEVGDTAFVLSDEVRCIDVHRLPGYDSPISLQIPKGEQVRIIRQVEREDLAEVWYEVSSLSSGRRGWLSASNVGNELNNVSLPPEPCD